MISGIYSITSPEGKVYIGLSKDIKRRWKQYKHKNHSNQGYIKQSIKQHGYDKHRFDILERCDCADLYDKEVDYKRKFIDEYGWDKVLFMKIYDKGKSKYKNPETRARLGGGIVGTKVVMRRLFYDGELETYVVHPRFRIAFMSGDMEDVLY